VDGIQQRLTVIIIIRYQLLVHRNDNSMMNASEGIIIHWNMTARHAYIGLPHMRWRRSAVDTVTVPALNRHSDM